MRNSLRFTSLTCFLSLSPLLAPSVLSQPLPEPQPPIFELGRVDARPGETELEAAFSITVVEGILGGWGAVIHADASVLTLRSVADALDADYFQFLDQSVFVEPGIVAFVCVPSWTDDRSRMLAPSASRVTAWISFCVLETAPSGTHPIDILESAERSDGNRPVQTLYNLNSDDLSVQFAGLPVLRSGAVTVRGEPVPDGNCASFTPPPLKATPSV
jgi:hypothetical protein